MILTIKGADFSLANIGTLDTFSIRKTIGKGTVHSIPNFVTKNSSVEWTITLEDSYDFIDYSITMGNEVITPVISGKMMIISIPVIRKHMPVKESSVISFSHNRTKPITDAKTVVRSLLECSFIY